jgi:hypothetical protein
MVSGGYHICLKAGALHGGHIRKAAGFPAPFRFCFSPSRSAQELKHALL